jgi:Flp pilus assembly protein TadD
MQTLGAEANLPTRYRTHRKQRGGKELAAAYPDNSQVVGYLARGFGFYQHYAQAACTYEVAAKQSHDPIERLRLLKNAAEAHARAEAPEAVSAVIIRMKAAVEASENGQAIVLDTLRSLAEIAGDNDALVGVVERIVDLDPSDTSTRFALAYKHQEIGNDDLALFHYLRIPAAERSSTTWNNLGVAFDHFRLAAKAAAAYRTAEEMGDTLAMSNLAEKYIKAGFLLEAEKECTDALKHEQYDKNVTTTLARVKSVPENEQKEENQILQKTKERRDFYKDYGEAMLRTESHELAKHWQGPNCILDVTTHGSEFLALGSYESMNALTGLGNPFGLHGRPAPDHYRIEYRGTWVRGGAIRGSVTRRREGDSPGVLSLGTKDNVSVLMMLTKDETEIRVMEPTTAANARFYTFTKIDGT